jgi:hypothetical protein
LPKSPLQRHPGDRWLVIERRLVDRRERQRGRFSVVAIILRAFPTMIP